LAHCPCWRIGRRLVPNTNVVWRTTRGAPKMASPLFADGNIYCFGQEGKATVLKAGQNFQVVATNTLADGFMASPAVDGRALILRTKKNLYRIETDGPAGK
jgi:outer membrane protein assembly factor BamB